jgi:nucleoside-diphosphate-sugar epimerase
MRNILIIGGGGYIGTVLSKFLLNNNHKVKVLDNFIYKNFNAVKELKDLNNFLLINGDLCLENTYPSLMTEVTDVIILGGLVGDPITKKYPELHYRINIEGIKNCINKLKEYSFNKLIFISTCSNYGLISDNEVADENFPLNPLSLYAKAKVDIEKFILSLKNEKINFEPLILRFATAFGASPRMRFDLTINEFAYELLKGNELVVYDADTWRPYCHVNDFSRLILKVLDDQKNNLKFEIFNVGSDANNFTKRQIAELIADKISGSKVKFKKGDIDPRNYKVNFQKLSKIDFQIKHNVKDEIDELINFIKNNDFKEKKFFGNYEIK